MTAPTTMTGGRCRLTRRQMLCPGTGGSRKTDVRGLTCAGCGKADSGYMAGGTAAFSDKHGDVTASGVEAAGGRSAGFRGLYHTGRQPGRSRCTAKYLEPCP